MKILERLLQDLEGFRQICKISFRHWATGRDIRTKFRAVQRAGEKIVLDDFGPPIPLLGHSSLRYIFLQFCE